MSHIQGHWDGDTIGAKRSLSSMGILYPKGYKDFKILFFNNRQTDPDELDDNKTVAFQLLLFPIGIANGKEPEKFNAIAIDVVPYFEHEQIDVSSKKRFNNRKVEELDEAEMKTLASEVKVSGKDVNGRMQSVVYQTMNYKFQNPYSFDHLYKRLPEEKRIPWIIEHVKNYGEIGLIQPYDSSRSSV
jgi:hypothetical protein